MKAKEFLHKHISAEASEYFSSTDSAYLEGVVSSWMNDTGTSIERLKTLKTNLPRGHKILDMASGCGTFVFGGLLAGFSMFGSEPEHWKNSFNQLKAVENEYPISWGKRFVEAKGESLPFKDNSFDGITSFQTLEHVQDVKLCLREMLRITKPGGGLHLQCPDYTSTYEPHYRLPWIPLMPKKLAKFYLKIMGKSTLGLNTINYTTPQKIKFLLKKVAGDLKMSINIRDLTRERFYFRLKEKGLPNIPGTYALYKLSRSSQTLFRAEKQINLWVEIQK